MGCSGLCPVCPVPSCPVAKGKVSSPSLFLRLLKKKPVCAAAVDLQHPVPCEQGHTNPLGAGIVISSVTQGAQGTQ